MKPRCLFVGDGCVSTGFARMNHAYLDGIKDTWDVHMLALNYSGDPHPYPYAVYHPMPRMGGDRFGVARLPELLTKLRPDVVVVVNDPWNIPHYLKHTIGSTPMVASVAVDGLNCRGTMMNGLRHAIFWTDFGLQQARLGGYTGPASVVPLGVDLSVFAPTAQAESRRRVGLPGQLTDSYIVGVVGRNHPRKRIDLAMMYFAEWVHRYKIHDAYLYLHVGPTGDAGYDVDQLAAYLQIQNRIIAPKVEIGHGVSEEHMKYVYGSFDVMLSCTQGEGWGLTHMEGMACGVPQILPDWSALGEWARSVARLVPCTTVACTPNNINVVGGVPDKDATVDALQEMYASTYAREWRQTAGLTLVSEDRFRWENIGKQFAEMLDECRSPMKASA